MRMSAFLGFLYVYIGWNRYVFGIIEGALWPWLNSLVWRGVVWCGSSLNSLGETRRVKKSFCFLGDKCTKSTPVYDETWQIFFFPKLDQKVSTSCLCIHTHLAYRGRQIKFLTAAPSPTSCGSARRGQRATLRSSAKLLSPSSLFSS